MVIVKSKGTVLNQTISGGLVAVAQVISIGMSGAKSGTFSSDSLDAAVGEPMSPTGTSTGGEYSFEFFYDPALAGHKAIFDVVADPCTYADLAWQVIFADAGLSEWDFASAGVGVDVSVALGDGLKGSATIQLTGLPTFPA